MRKLHPVMGRARTFRTLIAAAAALAVVAAACDSGGDDAPAGGSLGIEDTNVDVRDKGREAFNPADDGQDVIAGDTIRTDETGQAQLDYSDDSYTRLDVNTEFTIDRLTNAQGDRRVESQVDAGQTWNRVEELSESESFEQGGEGANATVRGTAYVVRCDEDGNCTFIVVIGSVLVETADGTEILLEEGQTVTVDADGNAGPVRTLSADELNADPWIRLNLEKDARRGEDITGRTTKTGAPNADDLARSRLEGEWTVQLTATDASGFEDLAGGDVRTRTFTFLTSCPEGIETCSLSLTRASAVGARATSVAYIGDGVYQLSDPTFPSQDCRLSDGRIAVAGGIQSSVTLEFNVVAALVEDGAWTATEIGGTSTETASPTPDQPDCLPGAATFSLTGSRSG